MIWSYAVQDVGLYNKIAPLASHVCNRAFLEEADKGMQAKDKDCFATTCV